MDIGVLLLSFTGVTILIIGTPSKGEEENHKTYIDFLISTLILILIPVLSASVTLFIRHLKALSEVSIGAYMTFAIIIIYGPYVYLNGEGMSLVHTFDGVDYLLCVCLGLTSTIVQLAKTRALHYEQPAKLSSLMYLQSVIQLLLDVAFLGTHFTLAQAIGIALVIGANCVKGVVALTGFFACK